MTRPVGDLRRHPRQRRGDVFVRQAVKPVALDAGAADLDAAAESRRRPPGARDGSRCRSRRPAARREAARRRHRSRRGCAAGGAARGAPASAGPRAPAASPGQVRRTPRRRARRGVRRRGGVHRSKRARSQDASASSAARASVTVASSCRASSVLPAPSSAENRGVRPDALDLAAGLEPPGVGGRCQIHAELQAR